MRSVLGDVRDADALRETVTSSGAEIVFHLAAQPLVRASYADPSGTFATNVMGTVNLLEAVRTSSTVRAVVVVTSDKCYDVSESGVPHRESDRLGGRDPYSSSKACAELVTAAYRTAFLSSAPAPAVATARAGNVIGGGDWAADRLLPDLLRALASGESATIRNPDAVRPWQHVLDAVHGYLLLAEALAAGTTAAEAWNFGPEEGDARTVRWVVENVTQRWGGSAGWCIDTNVHPPETAMLRLDSSKARARLGWRPRLDIDAALHWTVEWHRAWLENPASARDLTKVQIAKYEGSAA
jgi:CDP-glucose 4,6-dehydratase